MARTARLVRVDRVSLAFGLDWVPLLGDPDAMQAQARRQGATHRVLSGDPPAALGLARGLPAGLTCWSAADLLARVHPRGTVACVVPIGDNWHVLAVHEGVPLARADRSYPAADLASEAIAALRRAHPKLELLAVQSGQYATGLLDTLARLAPTQRALEPVRRRGMRLVLLAGMAVLGGSIFMRWGNGVGAAVTTDPDARSRWQAALQQTLGQHPLHGEPGTRALLAALYRQPVRLAGWSLHGLRCQSGPDAARWHCVGEYRRQDRLADNRTLLRLAPAGWRLDFPSLDLARAAWTVALPGQPPDAGDLPRAGLLDRDWASALQAVLPAFSALRLEAARPLEVPAPRDDQGRALPVPADFPVVAVRALRVEGPLRSGMLLAPLARAVSWHKAALTLAPGTRPGVRASSLTLHLEGVVYESRS